MALGHCIEVVLFDLDNTLYPPSSGLLEAGDALITAFIADRLGLPGAEADELRRRLWREYGTTARGLEIEHGVAQGELYEAGIERLKVADYLRPEPALAAMLSALPGRKHVFTNATRRYAMRVLAALGIAEAIEEIFDVEFAGGIPKPQREPYVRVLAALECPVERVALVEDTEANLEPAAELGMLTIKLGPPPTSTRHLYLPLLVGLPDLLRPGDSHLR